jgi:hypothetical protein
VQAGEKSPANSALLEAVKLFKFADGLCTLPEIAISAAVSASGAFLE